MTDTKSPALVSGRLVGGADASRRLFWVAAAAVSAALGKRSRTVATAGDQRPPDQPLVQAWVCTGEPFELRRAEASPAAPATGRRRKPAEDTSAQIWLFVATGPRSDPAARVIASRPCPTGDGARFVEIELDRTALLAVDAREALGLLQGRLAQAPPVSAAERESIDAAANDFRAAATAATRPGDTRLRVALRSTGEGAAAVTLGRDERGNWLVNDGQRDANVKLSVLRTSGRTAAGLRLEHATASGTVRIHQDTAALTFTKIAARPEEHAAITKAEVLARRMPRPEPAGDASGDADA
ncbi:MAG: hypothetical protein KBA72_11285 [Thermoanaerobaculia bacterium]|nr:hypothetical protein [Thermoanaerobaculia bacterium]